MSRQKTTIMGILNTTPDSFSDGGLYTDRERAINRVREMLNQGADIIDIGGESTRPGSEEVDAVEETQRVLPLITFLKNEIPQIILSIDTKKAFVAEAAATHGCEIINSLGGFLFDAGLANVAIKHKTKFCIYHIKGIPKTMQKESEYSDVIKEIKDFFDDQLTYGQSRGMMKEQFILDPGIGFGKTLEQNLQIIQNFKTFQIYGLPLLIGVSRKSHLAALLQKELNTATLPTVNERLEASLAETAVAVMHGASIVRTHDVLETKKFLTVLDQII